MTHLGISCAATGNGIFLLSKVSTGAERWTLVCMSDGLAVVPAF